MFLTLGNFTSITPMVLLLTFLSAFKNGKPTCDRYLGNSFLYVLSSLCIFITTIYIQREKKIISGTQLNIFLVIGLLVIIFGCMPLIVKTNNIALKHLLYLLIILYLGIILESFYKDFNQELIDETLVRVAVLSGVAILLILLFPNSFKMSFIKMIGFIFSFLVVASILDTIFLKSEHQIIFSYLFIFAYFVYLSYDSKFILERSKSCNGNADYIMGTFHIFLDLVGLFDNLLIVGND